MFTELMPVVRKKVRHYAASFTSPYLDAIRRVRISSQPGTDRQTVSMLVGGNLLRLGLRQTRA